MSATRKRKLRREVLTTCLHANTITPLRIPVRHTRIRKAHNGNLQAIREFVNTVSDRSAFDRALAQRLRNNTLPTAIDLALRDVL